MDGLLALWAKLVANSEDLLSIVAHLVLFASVIVKLTPTLKDDDYFKPIIKFIGKYIALDKYSPPK